MGEKFHDQEALDALTGAIVEALRPVGVTVDPHAIQFQIQEGQMLVGVMGLVRPQAKERADQDQDTREDFNQMMAEQNRLMQEEKREEIAELTSSTENLEKWLFEDTSDCSHEETHEELCLKCGKEIDE